MSGMKKRENGKRLGNRRLFSMGLFGASVLFLLLVAVFGYVWQDAASVTDFSRKNLPPCAGYLFGTDWMGRDMFVRTVAGLSMSIRLGLLTAAVSAVIAFLLGLSAAVLGRAVDGLVTLLIDLVMGIPHMLLLILISFACGKGFWGVTLGIALTHWASLARLIRGEVFQLRESPYIRIAGKLGKSRAYLAFHHMAPNLLPQFITGLILMFPHAILHEASITFLGFGLSPEEPAIGIILSESMKYLAMGKWWLALFPGLLLTAVVRGRPYAGWRLRAVSMSKEEEHMENHRSEEEILTVKGLSVSFTQYDRGFGRKEIQAVTDLDLRIRSGEIVAVVGASGSGKSLLAHAVMGILPYNASMSGEILFKGTPLTSGRVRRLRGHELVLVPQSVTYLDPLMKTGQQLTKGRKNPEISRHG